MTKEFTFFLQIYPHWVVPYTSQMRSKFCCRFRPISPIPPWIPQLSKLIPHGFFRLVFKTSPYQAFLIEPSASVSTFAAVWPRFLVPIPNPFVPVSLLTGYLL